MGVAPRGVNSGTLFNILSTLKLGQRVFFELAIQRPLADAEDLGCFAAVAARLLQGPPPPGAPPPRPPHAGPVAPLALRAGGPRGPGPPPPPPPARGAAPP